MVARICLIRSEGALDNRLAPGVWRQVGAGWIPNARGHPVRAPSGHDVSVTLTRPSAEVPIRVRPRHGSQSPVRSSPKSSCSRVRSVSGLSNRGCWVVHRYYDPATGQFLNVDPLADQTGASYFYAGDDPLNRSDPWGLCSGWGCVGFFLAGTEEAIDAGAAAVLGVVAETASVASCAVVGPLCSVPIVVSLGIFAGAGALAYFSFRDFAEVFPNPPTRNIEPRPFAMDEPIELSETGSTTSTACGSPT